MVVGREACGDSMYNGELKRLVRMFAFRRCYAAVVFGLVDGALYFRWCTLCGPRAVHIDP